MKTTIQAKNKQFIVHTEENLQQVKWILRPERGKKNLNPAIGFLKPKLCSYKKRQTIYKTIL